MKCKDCIHEKACKQICDVHGLAFGNSPFCDHYKDKSLLVELPCKVGTNFEKITSSIDVLLEFLDKHTDFCTVDRCKECSHDFICKECIKQWLEQECEE